MNIYGDVKMAEFGYHPIGGGDSGVRSDEGRLNAGVFRSFDFGQCQSITMMPSYAPEYTPKNYSCAIYEVNEEGTAGNLIGYTVEILVDYSMHMQWVTFDMATTTYIEAGKDYMLACWAAQGSDEDRASHRIQTSLSGYDVYRRKKSPYYVYPNFYDPYPITEPYVFDAGLLIYLTYDIVAAACSNPEGYEGQIICGDPAHGQNPDNKYECQCSGGVCDWVDLGYSEECDVPEDCVDPVGSHGDIICGDPTHGQDPTFEYQCNDGIWEDLGYNPDCDIPEGCIDPPGYEGQIICGNSVYGQDPTHSYECLGGMWNDRGYNSACGEPPPGKIPWTIIAIVGTGIAAAAIIGIALLKRK